MLLIDFLLLILFGVQMVMYFNEKDVTKALGYLIGMWGIVMLLQFSSMNRSVTELQESLNETKSKVEMIQKAEKK